MSIRIAIYCRVSSEDQARRETILTQRQFCQKYAEQAGLDVTGIYSDDGASGTIPMHERPEGGRLLSDAASGLFDAVLVYKVDRLGRDNWVTEDAVRRLEKASVAIISATEAFDGKTAHGRLLRSILGATASYERELIKQRSLDATRRLAADGVWLGGIVPYGYRTVGEGKDRRLALSEEPIPGLEISEVDVVRLVYRLCADDGWACWKIAHDLNTRGVPTAYAQAERAVLRGKRREKTQGVWRQGRVRALLTSTTYKGVHVWGRRTDSDRPPIERLVPPIVPEATWDRAQATLRANLLFSARNAKRTYLFRGLLKCAICGRTYVGVPAAPYADGAERSYYRCAGRHLRQQARAEGVPLCKSPNVMGRQLEAVVMADILRFLTHPQTVATQLRRSAAREIGTEADRRRQVAQYEKRISGLEAERQRVLTLYTKRLLTDREMETRLDAILSESDTARDSLAHLRQVEERQAAAARHVAEAEAMLERLRVITPEALSAEAKRALVQALLQRATVLPLGKDMAEVVLEYSFGSVELRTDTGTATGADINPRIRRSHRLVWSRRKAAKEGR
jgi:site-specific DNA recombinase